MEDVAHNSLFQDEGKFDARSITLKSWNDYVRLRLF